jgi:hypothetical protein
MKESNIFLLFNHVRSNKYSSALPLASVAYHPNEELHRPMELNNLSSLPFPGLRPWAAESKPIPLKVETTHFDRIGWAIALEWLTVGSLSLCYPDNSPWEAAYAETSEESVGVGLWH